MLLYWSTSYSAEGHAESGAEIRMLQRWCGAPETAPGLACKVVVSLLYYPLDVGDLHAKIHSTPGRETDPEAEQPSLGLYPT